MTPSDAFSSTGRIIIAGAGEAGVAAAAGLRSAGYRGHVLLLNDEPDLPYARPPLSKEMLAGQLAEPTRLKTEAWYADQGIDLASEARLLAIDPAARRAEIAVAGRTRQEAFDAVLLATGSRARTLPHRPGLPVFTLRRAQDLRALAPAWARARRVLVVGGGVIGLEAAAVARAEGRHVTIIEAAPSVMARSLPAAVARQVEAHHERLGAVLRLGVAVQDLSRRSDGVAVVLSDGEELVGDLVLVTVGVAPNTELATSAGCQIGDGVLVDAVGRTSVERVYAAGDVAAFPYRVDGRRIRVESWQHAVRHGDHVGRAMAGQASDYGEIPWFWSDQGDLNLQVAGLATTGDRTLWRGGGSDRTALHFLGDRLVAATTFNNGRDIRPLTRLIAARWQGDPTELTDEALSLAAIVKAATAHPNHHTTGETASWVTS